MSAALPEGVDQATGEVRAAREYRLAWEPMTAVQAEEATNTANAYLLRSPQLVKDLKDGQAWEALGFPSWHAYVEERLVISVQYADLLVKFATRLEMLAEAIDVDAALLAVNERALRGLPTETMVSVATDAVAELADDASDLERAEAAADAAKKANADRLEEAARRGREKAEADLAVAKAERARVEAEAEQARQERAAKRAKAKAAQDPGQNDDHSPVVDAGSKDDEGQADHATAPLVVELAEDWRTDVDNAVYLRRHPVALLAAALTDDDRIDLTDLHTHLTAVLAQEQNT